MTCPCLTLLAKQGKSIKYPGSYQIRRNGLSSTSGWNTFIITGKARIVLTAVTGLKAHLIG